MKRKAFACELLCVLFVAGAAHALPAAEELYVIESVKDTTVAINTSFCDGVPFATPTRMAASLYPAATDQGRVRRQEQPIGSATSCMSEVLQPGAKAGAEFKMAAQFVLRGTTLNVTGICRMLAPEYPAKGLTLASCALASSDSAGVAGTATSNTMLNLGNVAGYRTSSVWTLRVYN